MFAGNLTANLIRNVWSYAIIFCGHFPDGTQEFSIEETMNESRGTWYFRQILGSANLTGGKLFHLLSGNLSHQIEHHLFPDMPARRRRDSFSGGAEICNRRNSLQLRTVASAIRDRGSQRSSGWHCLRAKTTALTGEIAPVEPRKLSASPAERPRRNVLRARRRPYGAEDAVSRIAEARGM